MAIVLRDDGTLNTVLYCTECGEEERFNFSPESCEECEKTDAEECTHYDDFVDWCIEQMTEKHRV